MPTIAEEYQAFLLEWDGKSSDIGVTTSGSTGTPKEIRVAKKRMRASAEMTCDFLGLTPEDTALLCLSPRYIAGKMMIVRQRIRGFQMILREPTLHPLHALSTPVTFTAMIPAQAHDALRVPEEREILARIKHVIIGGGPIDAALEAELRAFPNALYSTYGMTETLSHVAMRRLSGPEASEWYKPLPGVSLSLSPGGTLVIQAPALLSKPLETNDLAELLPDGRFKIIGRRDNVINSGGIKLQIETIEEKLRKSAPCDFAITALPDPRFGEVVTLLATRDAEWDFTSLDRYEHPRHVFPVDHIPMTGNGKIDRKGCRKLAEALQEQTKAS